MRTILCLQRFRASSRQRQEELDHCLSHNLRHPALTTAVLWMEPGAPPPPQGSVPIELRPLTRRLQFADWLRLAASSGEAIVLLANADIALGDGFLGLPRLLTDPRDVVALSRREAATAEQGSRIAAEPHWRQDLWAIRSDAPIDADLETAAALPIGRPGSDNRIAHVFWSHGLRLSNPALHLQAVHHQHETADGYDRRRDRLFGACSYVHPALAPGDPSELEHRIWSRQPEGSGGLLVQVEPEQGEGGEQPYLAAAALPSGVSGNATATPFHDRQVLQALRQRSRPLASHALALTTATEEAGPACADRLYLPLHAVQGEGCRLTLLRPQRLLGIALRLPLAAPNGARLRVAFGLAGASSTVASAPPPALALPVGPARAGGRLMLPCSWPAQPIAWLELTLACPPPAPAGAGGEGAGGVGAVLDATREGFLELQLLAAPGPASTEPVARWGDRFDLLLEPSGLLARDRFWPTPHRPMAVRGATPAEWFEQAFIPPLLDWKPDWIPRRAGHAGALLHWQGAPREAEARDRHAALTTVQGKPATYLGLPWHCFLQADAVPERLLMAYGARLRAMAAELAVRGRSLGVHTVCEAASWEFLRPWWRELGISDLWLVEPPGAEQAAAAEADGMRLRAWPALPPEGGDPAAEPGGWRSRPTLLADPAADSGEGPGLEHCRFALCPGGATADPHHLWRILAAGAVPVVVGELPWLPEAEWLLPERPRAWHDALILWSDAENTALRPWLAAIEPLAWQARHLLGGQLLRAARRRPCFGSAPPPWSQG